MVEIFRTGIKSRSQAEDTLEAMMHEFPDYKMNFDLDDRENILRVEGLQIHIQEILLFMNTLQYECYWIE